MIRGASISLLLLLLLSSSSSSIVGPVSKQFRRRHRAIDPMIWYYFYGLMQSIVFLFEMSLWMYVLSSPLTDEGIDVRRVEGMKELLSKNE